MSVMSRVLSFIGFENGETETKQRVKKEKSVKATYNFKKKQKPQRVESIDGVKVVYPEVFEDAKKYLTYIKKDEPLIVSNEECKEEEMEKILAYLAGAIEMVGGKLKNLEKDRYYILLPEDMEIEE